MFTETGMSDLKNADNDALLDEDPNALQLFLDHLGDGVCMLGMRFTSSKCSMLCGVNATPGYRSKVERLVR